MYEHIGIQCDKCIEITCIRLYIHLNLISLKLCPQICLEIAQFFLKTTQKYQKSHCSIYSNKPKNYSNKLNNENLFDYSNNRCSNNTPSQRSLNLHWDRRNLGFWIGTSGFYYGDHCTRVGKNIPFKYPDIE